MDEPEWKVRLRKDFTERFLAREKLYDDCEENGLYVEAMKKVINGELKPKEITKWLEDKMKEKENGC